MARLSRFRNLRCVFRTRFRTQLGKFCTSYEGNTEDIPFFISFFGASSSAFPTVLESFFSSVFESDTEVGELSSTTVSIFSTFCGEDSSSRITGCVGDDELSLLFSSIFSSSGF
eukprot:UN25643